ncbi:hypothetical protein [Chitinophaga sp. S165]|uniref:hypothetical protein n=1 Tax=Chitinophaga sp. S165 TaxID=2135462 RepID=UPI000D70F7FC|nr:hypothetical protein [Chitinophaga sp. S165]PWV56896.1 hypothetical protein C7475_1011416 [Chitinophaga sp. S165]
MKYLYLCILTAAALFVSCRKDNDSSTPPLTIPRDSIQVRFSADKIGLTELYESFNQKTPTFTVTKGKPNKTFTYELTGSNGLKRTVDTITKGIDTLDANGNAALFLPGLNRYKDGEITVKITLDGPDTIITAKTQKVENQIRDYRDFIHMGFYISSDTSAHYVQLNDFAFPDTVFTAAPGFAALYGSYDGQGHKITNLTIKSEGAPLGARVDVGLFRSGAAGSKLQNIRLELSEEGITCKSFANIGGIIGSISGNKSSNTSIINCSVKGNILVTADAKGTTTGGIVGYTGRMKIIGCSFRGNTSGSVTGGIAAILGSDSKIDMCYAYGKFDGDLAGGIIGETSFNLNISNSYAFAIASSGQFYAIAPAFPEYVTVTNSFANAGIPSDGVTMATLPDMNTHLAEMEITNWPQEVTPPANNKPYKNDTDPAAPMRLWWE